MKYKRIRFPKKLFKRKVEVLDANSVDDYEYFTDKINFDPLYFLDPENTLAKDIFSIMKLSKMGKNYYIDDIHSTYFDIELISFKETTSSFWRIPYPFKFIVESDNKLFVLMVYEDL